MQDSGVDGPHTTGMHRTSYRLHTLSSLLPDSSPPPFASRPRASRFDTRFSLLSPSSSASFIPLPLSHVMCPCISLCHSFSLFLFSSRPPYRLPVTILDVLMASTNDSAVTKREPCVTPSPGAILVDRAGDEPILARDREKHMT